MDFNKPHQINSVATLFKAFYLDIKLKVQTKIIANKLEPLRKTAHTENTTGQISF